MTCDPGVCTAVPTLPDSTIAAAFAGHTVQFVGDSVTAQFECDLRQVLTKTAVHTQALSCDEEVTPICPGKHSSVFNDLSGTKTTVLYQKAGCPWACVDSNQTAHQLDITLNGRNGGHNATTVVFNIGAHYKSAESLRRVIPYFLEALANSPAKSIVIRSPNIAHFKTPTGSYNASTVKGGCQAHSADSLPLERIHDITLRKLAGALQQHALVKARGARVKYMDVFGLSDFPHMHPTMHTDGAQTKVLVDCLHECQTCKVLRSWTSLLASLLMERWTTGEFR
jgi:hypothetical protein